MALTPLDNQSAVRDETSVLAATTSQEKATVLEQLLAAHPELVEEAEGLAGAVLMSATADVIADDVADRLGSLGFEDLAARAGRIPGRGYVDEAEAAWELLEEAIEPFLADLRRRAALGFIDASASIATGTIAGLRRLQDAPDGQLIAFAGDDTIDTLTETVLDLADNLRIELDERASQI